MGRNWNSERLTRLDIKPPSMSIFRCPISLEVMRSPVSLCTGVTYDRTSIQRWLDSGNTTCPATNLPLPSTDLIPNLTLRRLISTWSSSSSSSPHHHLLIHPISSSPDSLPLLHQLSLFFSDPDVDDSLKNSLINASDFAAAVVSVLMDGDNDMKVVEAIVGVVSLVLNSDCIDDGNKEALIKAFTTCSNFDACVSSLICVLKDSTELESRTNSAKVLRAILPSSSSESELIDPLIQELTRLISNETSTAGVSEGLGCLIELLHSKCALKTMVKFGVVHSLVRILSPDNREMPSKVMERAIMILEAVASCRMGRAAMAEVLEECVEGVVSRTMKVGKKGREAAVGVLWNLCYCCNNDGDWRGKEVVARAKGGVMGKILVVMQGDCSPVVRRMAGDILRVFRGVDGKSLVAGYDTKTTHIMPF